MMYRRERKAFFFPHALVGRGGRPGRHAFDVIGTATNGSSATRAPFVVMADGMARNTVGCNQDPCVFSAPLGPFLSYCRIDVNNPRHSVGGARPVQRLPHVVQPDDVVIFGKYDPPSSHAAITSLWVDTVLVIEDVLPWPAEPGTDGMKRRFTMPPASCKTLPVPHGGR